jgi:hypothetical protein
MKRMMSALIIAVLLSLLTPLPVFAEMTPAPADLQTWMKDFQASYINSDPTILKPIIPITGWNMYAGGDWTYQYPSDWTVLSGDALSFLACDSRQLACYDYVQMQPFQQPLSHDQVGVYAFSRVAGDSPFQVEGTFQKNILPQLMLTPPSGISQIWFVRWKHPQAGNMFTMLQVVLLSYFNSFAGGNASASWSSWTAPEGEFVAMAESVFVPMYYSSTYTIPGSGENDRDGDGYPDSEDNYPDDLNQH